MNLRRWVWGLRSVLGLHRPECEHCNGFAKFRCRDKRKRLGEGPEGLHSQIRDGFQSADALLVLATALTTVPTENSISAKKVKYGSRGERIARVVGP
jgi:hypothetical protein